MDEGGEFGAVGTGGAEGGGDVGGGDEAEENVGARCGGDTGGVCDVWRVMVVWVWVILVGRGCR